jgi:4-amino-4-deoxy-L-arabinose transferase-like glycosyltransferase
MLIAALLATAAGIAGSLALMWGGFAIGGALLLASVLALRWPGSIWEGAPPAELAPRVRWLALLGVCAVAVFFRCYRLNPPGLWGDDAINGLLAFGILDGAIRSPFQIVQHSHSDFHALSNYPIAAMFWLFGADLTTLRLPGIILGTLSVPLLYATVAPLFGTLVGLLAALFYASSPPQVTHAKELVQIITGQFFQLAGLCLLVRGLVARRSGMIAAAALPLAGCVYTYHSARLAPVVALVYVAAVLWHQRRRRRQSGAAPSQTHPSGTAIAEPPSAVDAARRIALTPALLLFAAALVPAVRGYMQHPGSLVQRVNATSIWPVVRQRASLWPLWDAAWRSAMIFHYRQGPEYHWFGIGTDPALDVVVGFLCLHGLVESLTRWREPRHVLLLTWFAVGLLPGVFSIDAPRIYRVFYAMPPLYVWAAMPVARLFTAPADGWRRTALRAIAVGLVAAVPMVDFNYYFYRLYTHPLFRFFQGDRIVEMARELRARGPGWTGYLLADNFDAQHESLSFLSRAWGLHIRGVASLAEVLPLSDIPQNGALFMLSHGALGAAAAIERMYPGEELVERRDPAPRTWWLDAWCPLSAGAADTEVRDAFYAVPRAAALQPHLRPAWGLEAQYDIQGQRVTRREPYPFYNFLPSTFSRPFNVVWRGRLIVPEPGGYVVDVRSNADSTVLSLDGAPTPTDAPLAAGPHDFALQLRNVPPSARLTLSWHGADARPTLIPPSAFEPP